MVYLQNSCHLTLKLFPPLHLLLTVLKLSGYLLWVFSFVPSKQAATTFIPLSNKMFNPMLCTCSGSCVVQSYDLTKGSAAMSNTDSWVPTYEYPNFQGMRPEWLKVKHFVWCSGKANYLLTSGGLSHLWLWITVKKERNGQVNDWWCELISLPFLLYDYWIRFFFWASASILKKLANTLARMDPVQKACLG